jgi:hypothetical protein
MQEIRGKASGQVARGKWCPIGASQLASHFSFLLVKSLGHISGSQGFSIMTTIQGQEFGLAEKTLKQL